METEASFNLTTVPKDHVWTGAQIQELLDTQVKYKDWKFIVQEEITTGGVERFEGGIKLADIDTDIHIRAEWLAPDNVTGAIEKQQSRWWRVSKHSRKNEIINAAFALVKMAEEHEMRENFQYMFEGQWTMPYNTHTDVDWLAEASLHLDLRVDTRPEAPKNQRRD
jgi:hypothetical protein